MDALVLTPLDSIETHLSALITSLTQTNTFATAPQLAQDLLQDDDNLTAALSLLHRHQQNYAHILSLREEVSTLQEQLKDTVRKCVDFKKEIRGINPSILDDDSEDEDEEEDNDDDGEAHSHKRSVAEVDYHTLLTFAARIGKHNTIAAKEAEAEALRRKIAAKTAASTSASMVVNGTQVNLEPATQDTALLTTTSADEDGGSGSGERRDLPDNDTAETTAELSRIDNVIAIQRAQMGMSFPDAPTLRLGALGQLQLFRERQEQQFSSNAGLSGPGDDEETQRKIQDAVDKEVGRMVRETEDIAPEPVLEEAGDDAADAEGLGVPESPVLGRRDPGTFAARQPLGGGEAPAGQEPSQRPPKPAQPKRKLDLDFPDSDDDEDD